MDMMIRDPSWGINWGKQCQQYLLAMQSQNSLMVRHSSCSDPLHPIDSYEYNNLLDKEVQSLSLLFRETNISHQDELIDLACNPELLEGCHSNYFEEWETMCSWPTKFR